MLEVRNCNGTRIFSPHYISARGRDFHSLAEGYKTWDKRRCKEVTSSSLVQKSPKDLSEMEEVERTERVKYTHWHIGKKSTFEDVV